jgi:hypothetical protein
MTLQELLQQQRTAITKRWLDRTLRTYSARTAGFFKREKDPFANPVGKALSRGTEALFDAVVDGIEEAVPGPLSASLEEIIKIRAIQDFSPSEAVSFVFDLKGIVRDELGGELQASEVAADLPKLEFQIDRAALVAFDIFMKCREKLYELRLNEIKRTGYRLLRKHDLIADDPDLETDSSQIHI